MIYLNIIVPFSGRSSKGSFSKGFCKNSVWMSHLAQKKNIKKLHGPSCNGTWISDTTKSRTDHLTRPWGSSIHLPASPFLNSFCVKLLLWLWMLPVSFPALLFECELTTRMQVLSSLSFLLEPRSRSGCPQSSVPWYDLSMTFDCIVGLVP